MSKQRNPQIAVDVNKNYSAAYLGCAKYKNTVKKHAITQSEKLSYAAATKNVHESKNPVPAQAK